MRGMEVADQGPYDRPFGKVVDQGPWAVANARVAQPPEDERATRLVSVVLRDTTVPGYLSTQKEELPETEGRVIVGECKQTRVDIYNTH